MNTIPYLLSRDQVLRDMITCEQSPGQSVLDHGKAVHTTFQALYNHLLGGSSIPDWWRIPSWAYTTGLLDKLAPMDILAEYQIYHDCGKPYCLTVDADGKRHFPNHAEISEAIWRKIGGSQHAARLIGQDMDAHLLTVDGITEFSERPDAVSLLLTAIAEVHANAEMFGGQTSDSFKMKIKRLDQRGKRIISLIV